MDNIKSQPGFLPPGDDVMALVTEVSSAIRAIIKNEQDLNKAERSPVETSSSGGDKLPVKGMSKASPSASASVSPSASASVSPSAMDKASPSAFEDSKSGSPSASPEVPSAPPEAPPEVPSAPPEVPPEVPSTDDQAAPPTDDQPSFEELVQMFSQLSPEDLKVYVAAIKQATQGGASVSGPVAPPSAMPSAVPPSPSMPAMGKSESDVWVELKKAQDQITAVAEALTAIVTAPKRKAVNGLTVIPMQKSEEIKPVKVSFEDLKKNADALHNELKRLTMPDSTLTKRERDLISDFYCRGISVDDLAPIFNK